MSHHYNCSVDPFLRRAVREYVNAKFPDTSQQVSKQVIRCNVLYFDNNSESLSNNVLGIMPSTFFQQTDREANKEYAVAFRTLPEMDK